eukprot:6801052-Prymnesium_polylepis.1
MLSPAAARACAKAKDWPSTLAHCRAARVDDAGAAYALGCLEGLCCLQLGRHEEAVAAFRAAAAAEPEGVHAWRGLLRVYAAYGSPLHDGGGAAEARRTVATVSYTHLTLPTICSV